MLQAASVREVFVIVCVLVSCSHALIVENAPCDISIRDNDLKLNCSRRNLLYIPQWPEQMNQISKDANVLITLFNNSITNVTGVPAVAGSRVAISLKSNKIVEVGNDAFSKIERLVYLDLSNNYISGDVLRGEIFQGPYKDGVYGNISLETLILGNNNIHSLDRKLFLYTPNLTRLSLNDNPIEILDHVTILALNSAKKLQFLDLSNTEIDDIPQEAFMDLKKLQHLDLSGNKFTIVPENLAVVGASLEYLTFNNNPIVELYDDSFVGLTKLVELEVGQNLYLEEVKRSTFTTLTSLRVLHLCHNPRLRYISHNAFRGLTDQWTLKEVYLDFNNLSELSTDLMPWNKLEILGMTGNKWLCNCDLADIVTRQAGGTKFKPGEMPHCAAPPKMSGMFITNITDSFCPTFDNTFSKKKTFSISDLKPKHILWSIFGVGMVVLFGMLVGLLVNTIKVFYYRKIKGEPIPYIKIIPESGFK